MYAATKGRYLAELAEMAWRDIRDAQVALGILADKIVPTQARNEVHVDARVAAGRIYATVARRDERP